jgi:hypothetical protein
MRPAWAAKGAPNVLSARDPGAAEIIKSHAEARRLKVVETVTVTKGGTDVVFARCEPKANPT